MRTLLVLFAGVGASACASLVVWAALELEDRCSPHYELLEDRMILTNASTHTVNDVTERVLEANRPAAPTREERYDRSEFTIIGDMWFNRTDVFGCKRERIGRLVYKQRDQTGAPVRVELLRGPDTPTFIFVEHPSPDLQASVARQLAAALEASGVDPR